MKKPSTRRELLQLAEDYNPLKHNIAGWFISEKLDGKRAFWDGGLTRGMLTKDVPWAGVTHPKTGEPKDKVKPISTGLWSRYGNPIAAPDSFLDSLPKHFLDGELWAGLGNYQLCMSICNGDEPDERFESTIRYAAYSFPPVKCFFQDGEIKNANMHKFMVAEELQAFLAAAPKNGWYKGNQCVEFENEYQFLTETLPADGAAFYLKQTKLSEDEATAKAEVEAFLQTVLDKGGEGVIIRDPEACWTPKRHNQILKYKPFIDSEARVYGFRSGKEGKIGQVLGKIGTLLVESTKLKTNVKFELGSGLKMLERDLTEQSDIDWAKANPGLVMPTTETKHFKVGDIVTFKYRELTKEGIPKEGRYWRKRWEK